ncbi:LysE family translocator [Micrococcus lylae]|uniref:LysE family translocator n=1 Tax=Micrococcus lylae TaxID=1273 RepID=UPI003EC09DF4
MEYGQALLAFTGVALLLTVTPGLDMALVLRSALTRGRSHALVTGLGVCAGALVWGLAAAVGIAALLAASDLAYTALKAVGAAYLIWLGVSMIRATLRRGGQEPDPVTDMLETVPADPGPAPAAAPAERLSRGFLRGFTTNLLNPKVGVFYLALIPQFMAQGVPAWLMGLSLAGVHAALTLVFFAVLIAAAHAFRRLLTGTRATDWIDRVTGGVLLLFGGLLLLDDAR